MASLPPDSSLTDVVNPTAPSPTSANPVSPATPATAPASSTPGPTAAPSKAEPAARPTSDYEYNPRDLTSMRVHGKEYRFVYDPKAKYAGIQITGVKDAIPVDASRVGQPLKKDGTCFELAIEVWLRQNLANIREIRDSERLTALRDYAASLDAQEATLGIGRDLVARVQAGETYATQILSNHARWRGEIGQKASEWYNYALAMRVWAQRIAGQLPDANRPTHLNRLEWNVLNFSGKATNKLSGPETQEAAANLLAELAYVLYSVPKEKRNDVLQTITSMGAAAYSILKHAGQEKDLVARAIDGLATTVTGVDKDALKATYDTQLAIAYETAVRGA